MLRLGIRGEAAGDVHSAGLGLGLPPKFKPKPKQAAHSAQAQAIRPSQKRHSPLIIPALRAGFLRAFFAWGKQRTFSDVNSDDPAHISAPDRSFMRALLHDDYLRMKTTILTDELQLMRATPGASLYVMFDYGTDPYGPCAVIIHPTSDLLERFPCLEDYVVRAARSHGRMKLRVACGGNASIRMFPLRSATGETAEGLDGMATDDEAETAGPVGLIQELVGRGIQEIHI
ncbi:hypothetical protein FB451DRAFT_1187506 [Mycena latifolia]|nr:hypothetical protein FB451DRAFT_1187506 [Mycena latifolia]